MPRVHAAVVVLLCAAVLSACASAPPPTTPAPTPAGAPIAGGVAVGPSVHTLAVGGRTRAFRVYRPSALPANAPAPLVVMIHGGGGSARGAEDRYGWDPEADREHFLVAYPDGVGSSWNGGQGGCCGVSGRENVDERIPFDGRPGEGPNHITGGPVPGVVASWRTVDGCAPPAVTTAGPVHTTAAACPGGRAVVLIEIDGAGHQWPGGAPPGPGRRDLADPPSTALDATDVIWGFFRSHPGPGAV